jgi:hypothetical protein
MAQHEQHPPEAVALDHPSASLKREEGVSLPQHLAALPGGPWALWRWVGLRGAGFPATQVLRLSAPACAAAADRLLEAESEEQRAYDALGKALNQALSECQSDLNREIADTREPLMQELRALRKAMRQLKQRRLSEPIDSVRVDTELIDAFRAAGISVTASQEQFYPLFEASLTEISSAIREVAGSDHFREAVLWQNRQAIHGSIAALLRQPAGTPLRNAQQRKNEQLVANYLQRYCVKNDTIGFFGPFGWARLEAQQDAVSVRPGTSLLATRTVYLEDWCVNALAGALASDEALQPWFVPRRLPFVHVEGTTLYLPVSAPAQLSEKQAAVLRACDGERTAKAIAMDLLRIPSLGVKGEEEVYTLLKNLRDLRRIAWTLEIPTEGAHPERHLWRLIEQIEDEHLRSSAVQALTEFEAARSGVAGAVGDVERLDGAMDNLEATFTRLTGADPTRRAGETYAARTLVYEDCRRDIEVDLGTDILQALGPPLTLLLTSARWFTFELAALYRKAFRETFNEVYAQFPGKAGARTVDLTNFWLWSQSYLFGDTARPLCTLIPVFQQRWSNILSIPAGQQRVAYTSAELQSRVQAAFAAPRPGWKAACYHSPDVMIAAASADAIRRDHYQLVLGELHMGANALSSSCFLAQHPAPEDIFRASAIDLPESRVVAINSREWGQISRTHATIMSPNDIRLTFAHDTCVIPQARWLPIGALVVEDTGDELIVRTRDGRLRFDIIEVFSDFLTLLAVNSFKLLPPDSHTPGITIDRLVVCRETWRFNPAELWFADEDDEPNRFVAARQWMRDNMMPRFVFVKVPVEQKPFYVDFDSPIYVNILAKMIRQTVKSSPPDAHLTITEMLPDHEHVWLPDAEGRHYTSELRIVAVDGYAR